MIKALRKRHLQIWIIWAILLPVGIIVAWKAVPKKVTHELLQQKIWSDTSWIISSIETENYKANIRLDSLINENALRLEFIYKKGMSTSSLLLYRVNDSTTNNIDKQELLGRIEGKGSQYFPLNIANSPIGWGKFYYMGKFIMYDIIKKQVVDSIIFKR